MAQRYSCAFNGLCEPDRHGAYSSSALCERECEGQPNKELTYLAYNYNPEGAYELAPSDRIRLLKDLLHVETTSDFSYHLLKAYSDRNWWDFRRLLMSIPEADPSQFPMVEDVIDISLLNVLRQFYIPTFPLDYLHARQIFENEVQDAFQGFRYVGEFNPGIIDILMREYELYDEYDYDYSNKIGIVADAYDEDLEHRLQVLSTGLRAELLPVFTDVDVDQVIHDALQGAPLAKWADTIDLLNQSSHS
jgi:hypothetical protein